MIYDFFFKYLISKLKNNKIIIDYLQIKGDKVKIIIIII